jgi:hypothetical protein
MEIRDDGVKVMTRGEMRNRARRKRGLGRRSKWYDRKSVVIVAERPHTTKTVLVDVNDLVVNNGSIDLANERKTGIVTCVDTYRKTVTVICEDGIIDWHFSELERFARGS